MEEENAMQDRPMTAYETEKRHEHDEKPPRYHGPERSLPAIVLFLMQRLLGGVSGYRLYQQVLWLKGFVPLGFPYEVEIMIALQTCVLASLTISVLFGLLSLAALIHPGKPVLRSMAVIERFRGFVRFGLSLLLIAVFGILIYLTAYYRLSITVLGIEILLGVVFTFAALTSWRFHLNSSRILRTLVRARREGKCRHTLERRCCYRFQSLTGLIVAAVPAAMVLIGMVGLMAVVSWLDAQLTQIGLPVITPWVNLLLRENTGAVAMYGVDLVSQILICLSYLMCMLGYGVYLKAFDARPVRDWHFSHTKNLPDFGEKKRYFH